MGDLLIIEEVLSAGYTNQTDCHCSDNLSTETEVGIHMYRFEFFQLTDYCVKLSYTA